MNATMITLNQAGGEIVKFDRLTGMVFINRSGLVEENADEMFH